MKNFISENYKEYYVLYKQNPDPVNPEILYYRIAGNGNSESSHLINWMGTCLNDATQFTDLDRVVAEYVRATKETGGNVGVMLVSTILNTIPTDSFSEQLHDKTVGNILKKLEPDEINYLKESGVLK